MRAASPYCNALAPLAYWLAYATGLFMHAYNFTFLPFCTFAAPALPYARTPPSPRLSLNIHTWPHFPLPPPPPTWAKGTHASL